MRTFKKIASLLLAVVMLASMAVVTSAEEVAVIDETILHSITVEENTGNGLAFRIQMNVKGAEVNALNEFVNTNATATIDGEEYSVVKMGAVMTNQPAYIGNIDNITVDDVNAGRTILDVPAKYLCAEPEAESCAFAVRIIHLPDLALGRAIACRPYIVVEKDGVESTIYGTGDISTYKANYYGNVPDETPVLDLSALADVDEKIAVAASAEYVAYETVNYAEAFKVSLTLTNTSANAKTSAGDSVTYAFKDAEGNVLGTEQVVVDELTAGAAKDVVFYAPIGTTIEVDETDLTYVPDIELPAIGSDIDVTKKKNRIRVSAADASFNDDGTIHVSLTFKNYTSNWITEETDYVQYTYYNADDAALKTVKLYIGVIDTKKNKQKTFEFDVPADTTEVAITNSKITYWTEWA